MKKGILVGLSFLIFISTIIATVKGNQVLTLTGLTAESVLLLVLGIISAKHEDKVNKGEDSEIISVLEQENKEAKQRILALEKELSEMADNSQMDSAMEIARTEELKASYEEEISRLKSKLNEVLINSVEVSDAFLPPIEEESDHELIDVIQIANETIDELKSFAQQAGIKVHISSSDAKLMFKASYTRIKIMFKNIIDNSIKYMKRSGILVVTISNVGEDIFIVLKDNGAGLSENETKHIFELNYQGSNRISGNGLGLTQAKAIVDYYGGTIYAKSNLGKGMGVYIQLPTV